MVGKKAFIKAHQASLPINNIPAILTAVNILNYFCFNIDCIKRKWYISSIIIVCGKHVPGGVDWC
ncbi:MAG: hypothetical protein M1609_10050, partial [Firmicutes bacterium]|nr:hypothetical protein [Bacillota bacterium]